MIALINYDHTIRLIDQSKIQIKHQINVPELIAEYIPDRSIVVWNGLVPESGPHRIHDIVDALEGYERVILDCGSDRCKDILDNFQTDLPCYATSDIITYYKNNTSRVKFFPTDLVHLYTVCHTLGNFELPNSERTHKFSCLNANQWSHRSLTYLALSKKPYFKDMIFSWGRKTYQEQQVEDAINDIVLTDEEKDEIDALPKWISTHEQRRTGNDRSTEHPAFMNACLNVVTETQSRVDTPSVTEKTFKPILAGQFFVLIGQPGCIQFLRDMGIDCFDDIIDHSYDEILDDRQRIAEAINELDRLETLDLFGLHRRCRDRFEANLDVINNDGFLELPLEFDK
jgi:hypothetical protein